jgi:hypothetical protein
MNLVDGMGTVTPLSHSLHPYRYLANYVGTLGDQSSKSGQHVESKSGSANLQHYVQRLELDGT